MSETVTWVHDEMLSSSWLKPEQPALFVFDDEWIQRERISLKRIVFIYECLLEMPGVAIARGKVSSCVAAFAKEHGADRIETIRSEDPRLKRQAEELNAVLIDREPFVRLPGDTDLRRFSRYWRKAERHVLAKKQGA